METPSRSDHHQLENHGSLAGRSYSGREDLSEFGGKFLDGGGRRQRLQTGWNPAKVRRRRENEKKTTTFASAYQKSEEWWVRANTKSKKSRNQREGGVQREGERIS